MSGTDLAVVTREVVAIASRVGVHGRDLVITDVDAQAYDSVKFTGAKGPERVQGRGGTDMRVAIAAACPRRTKPSVIVVLTDGGTPWPDVKPPIPVVIVLVREPAALEHARRAVPSWARVVEISAGQPVRPGA